MSYAFIRSETLGWLLENLRTVPVEDRPEIPLEVAKDLREVVKGLKAPSVDENRIRGAGPMLSLEQHLELLADDESLELPTDRQGSAFWQLVASVVHKMMSNEGEAILRVIGAENEG